MLNTAGWLANQMEYHSLSQMRVYRYGLQCQCVYEVSLAWVYRYRYRYLSLLELPILAAHGAELLCLLSAQPLHDAVDVEAVAALAPHQRTVVTCIFTVGAAAIECHATDAASIIIGQPLPDSHAVPGLDGDFEARFRIASCNLRRCQAGRFVSFY